MANLYANLSKIRFLKKNYSAKFLFVAFIGIHIPLISIVIISITDNSYSNSLAILLTTLIATLVASALTLYFLNQLLWPLREAKKALGAYLLQKEMPALPVHYTDEAGLLLKELQTTIEQLDYLIGEKKDVITLLSHDIRTPFNQILSISNEIIAENNKEIIDQYTQTIKEVTVKNLLILNDILKLLKTEHIDGNNQANIELNSIAVSCIDHFAASAKAKSVRLQFTGTSSPVYVYGNQILLTEAVSNLLNNAIKFSFPGAAVELKTEIKDDRACLTVTDSGIGISQEDMHKIFHRFTSAGKTGTNGEHSSGVGLYLSRKVIQKMKGDLSVTSDGKNKGASFTAFLPLVAAEQSPATYGSHLKNGM
ncbi:MAG: HAMP domain-containing sensor histidine kinase [Bacteroidota bacterium]